MNIKVKNLTICALLILTSCTNFNSDYSGITKPLIDKWNTANNNKSTDILKEIYADNLSYYGSSFDKNHCVDDQAKFFKKNPDSYQSILGDIQYEKISDTEIKSTFVKRVTINNQTKDYPSFLIFKKVGSEYKISGEGEIGNVAKKTQSSNNLMDKGEIVRTERQLLEPKGFTIEGDFDGDGQREEIAEYYINPKNDEREDKKTWDWDKNGFGTTKLLCSNTAIKDYKVEGSSVGLQYLGTEGDLDGDGADEISFVRDWIQSVHRTMCVLSYKKSKWEVILSVPMNMDYSPEPDKIITKSSKPNTIIINRWENFEDGIKKIEMRLR